MPELRALAAAIGVSEGSTTPPVGMVVLVPEVGAETVEVAGGGEESEESSSELSSDSSSGEAPAGADSAGEEAEGEAAGTVLVAVATASSPWPWQSSTLTERTANKARLSVHLIHLA